MMIYDYFSIFGFHTMSPLRELMSSEMIGSTPHRQRGVCLLLLVARAVLARVLMYFRRAKFWVFFNAAFSSPF